MWTDKCYRVILNTKLFEKMKIDQANKKSLRLNAFDNGTIRIFLIKVCNIFHMIDEKFRNNEIKTHTYTQKRHLIKTTVTNCTTF